MNKMDLPPFVTLCRKPHSAQLFAPVCLSCFTIMDTCPLNICVIRIYVGS